MRGGTGDFFPPKLPAIAGERRDAGMGDGIAPGMADWRGVEAWSGSSWIICDSRRSSTSRGRVLIGSWFSGGNSSFGGIGRGFVGLEAKLTGTLLGAMCTGGEAIKSVVGFCWLVRLLKEQTHEGEKYMTLQIYKYEKNTCSMKKYIQNRHRLKTTMQIRANIMHEFQF